MIKVIGGSVLLLGLLILILILRKTYVMYLYTTVFKFFKKGILIFKLCQNEKKEAELAREKEAEKLKEIEKEKADLARKLEAEKRKKEIEKESADLARKKEKETEKKLEIARKKEKETEKKLEEQGCKLM